MALALGQVTPRLRLFGAAARRPQMQQTLLGAVDELKTACITPDALEKTAARCPGYLGDKLRDLALVLAAYDAVTAQGHADPTDRLTRLAERIPASALGARGTSISTASRTTHGRSWPSCARCWKWART